MSMHIGGASSKLVRRSAEPSSGGQLSLELLLPEPEPAWEDPPDPDAGLVLSVPHPASATPASSATAKGAARRVLMSPSVGSPGPARRRDPPR
ncbi:hypothetical protein GCM10027055_01510 [Janibacter alkaliphilus]